MQDSRKPRLIRNCRLSESPAQKDTLLMPEGVIRLKGTGADIVVLCNGERSVDEILSLLKEKYPAADPAQIKSEALGFLDALRQKRVLDFL